MAFYILKVLINQALILIYNFISQISTMIQIEVPDRAKDFVAHTVMALQERCEQFVFNIFSRIQTEQTEFALDLIDRSLSKLTEHLSKLLDEMNQDVLVAISSQDNKDAIAMLRIDSEPSKLGQSAILPLDNFTFEQQRRQQIIFNALQLFIDQEILIKDLLKPIIDLVKKQLQSVEAERFIKHFIQDCEQPLQQENQSKIDDINMQMLDEQNQLVNQGSLDSQQLKKKKKKKENQYQRLKQKEASEESELDRLKYLHYLRIIKMKKKYQHVRIQLFKKELKNLWFFKVTDKEIFNRIMSCNKEKLKLARNKFRKWRKELQKLTIKMEETCHIHKNKVFYLCSEEILKQKIYLCNQCLTDKQQLRQHYNHEISCKKHRNPIRYSYQSQSQRMDEQLSSQNQLNYEQAEQNFICQQCLYSSPKRKHCLVSSCHYQSIAQLCVQSKCIQSDIFRICPVCQCSNNNHKDHKRVKWGYDQIMEEAKLTKNVDIKQYQEQLIKAKETLKLNPLQKIRISYAERVLPILRFLESFGVYDNKVVERWIAQFMAEGKKEDFMVIGEVLKIKKIKSIEENRLNYLQTFNLIVERNLQEMFKQIWGKVQLFCGKIHQLQNISIGVIEAQLNIKYKSIIDSEADDKIVVFPMRLSDVNPIHRSRIQRIKVVKESEAQRDDKIRKEFRDKRGKFFAQQMRRKLIEAQVGAQQQREIIQLFSKTEEYQLRSLVWGLKQQNTLYKYRKTIESLSQTYKQIQKQFTAKLGECFPWGLIVSNEFSSLRFLRIQYAPKQHFLKIQREEYFSYSIDAFALFGFIDRNAQLESVALKGVQVSNMQQFVETLNPNNPDPYSMREESKRLKARRSWINLRLTLHSAYFFLHSYIDDDQFSALNFAFRLSALSYFRRQFQSLSGMTVVISYDGEDWGDHLEGLLQCLRAIKEIKIEIHKIQQPFLLLPLLKGLSSFTEITSLAFQHIKFRPQKSGAQLPKNKEQSVDSLDRFSSSVSAAAVSAMEESLSLLFKGNTVAHLRLFNCRNFPALPRIRTLRSIDLNLVSFWGEFDLGEFIKANRQLRVIRIQKMLFGDLFRFGKQYKCEIGEKTLNQLQCLRGDITQNGVCFGPISSPSPSKLKYLQIRNYNKIDANSLKPIFAKLAHLTQLRLSQFDFGYQLLSAIPSNNLEELSIFRNNTITDVDLQLTDCKWPYLRKIELYNCPQISERMLRLCKFKGLMEIRVDSDVLSWQGRKYLRERGIRVEINHFQSSKRKLPKKQAILNQVQQKLNRQRIDLQQKLQEQCFLHKNKVFYLSKNSIQDKNTYLCNKCLDSKEDILQNQCHEIVCKEHKRPIKYKLLETQGQKDYQHFKCQQCQQCSYNQASPFLSSCHYQVVQWLCFEPNCIRVGDFTICPACQKIKGKHNQHKKVKFNAQLLARLQKQRRTISIKIIKDSEFQRDQEIIKKWKDAKGIFFKQQIKKKLGEKMIEEKQINAILHLFMRFEQDQRGKLQINLDQIDIQQQYKTIIQDLQYSYERMNKQYQTSLMECLPWKNIKQNRLNILKVIHIQYNRFQYDFFSWHYQIDAFELFQFIYQNPQLEEVTIKGVNIKNVKSFMELLNPTNINPNLQSKRNQMPFLTQIKLNLKLALHIQYLLHSYVRSSHNKGLNSLSCVEDLDYFIDRFDQVSGITAIIRFRTNQHTKNLEKLIDCLMKIKKIKLIIDCDHQITKKLLRELTSFTKIASLTIQNFKLSQKSNNEFKDIQKSLNILFQKNTITHLALQRCSGFPSLPKITTLQSIKFNELKFSSEFDLNSFISENKSLTAINIRLVQVSCVFEENLLNQLQDLSINRCTSVIYKIFSPQISRIKFFGVQNINILGSSLKPIFSKLVNLNQLYLSNLDFDYQLLSVIPSKDLEEFNIGQNNVITNKDLQLIDVKWPCLKSFALYYCPKITEEFINYCKFKSLIKICIKSKHPQSALSFEAIKYFKSRGIFINF